VRDFTGLSVGALEDYLRSQAKLRRLTLVDGERGADGWYAALKELDPERADPNLAPDGIVVFGAEGAATREDALRALADSIDLANEEDARRRGG
jgi:hypothetical protein